MTVKEQNQPQTLSGLAGFKRDGNQVTFEFGPARLVVTVLTPAVVRVRYAPAGQFGPRRSWAVAREDKEYPGAEFTVVENPETVTLKTAEVSLSVRRSDGGVIYTDANGQVLQQDTPESGPQFNPDGSFLSNKVMPQDEYYYGFGERTGLLNKRGYGYTCWNIDPVDRNQDHGPGSDNMYQSIPFFMALQPQTGAYGFFLNNTYKTTFDLSKPQGGRFAVKGSGGELDYYLFYGPNPAQVVERYTELTGRMPLPPRWALGYQQSRWSYLSADRVREIAQEFRQREIPADVIYLDIDYMRGYRVFTWDPDRFADPKKLTEDLAKEGFKVVPIIDPGVKFEPHAGYQVFDQGMEHNYFIKKKDGELFHGYVWPDDSVFPDFARAEVRQWWGDLHKGLLEAGVAGIWNDMNEPSISSTPFGEWGLHVEMPPDTPQGDENERTDHAEAHNLYGYLEDMGTYQGLRRLQPDKRPFLLTRSGYAGIQRWSAVWTGDNTAVWEHLETSIAQLCNLGLSGVSFVGGDIGGFWGPSQPELWARWIEFGAFSPFCRGHSATGEPNKEPWEWGEEVEAIARRYLELRYRLLPYFYTLFEESSRTGAPVMRPLFYHYWQDRQTLNLGDQVLVGAALMLAPVYRPGQAARLVYLPESTNWYDFWTEQPVSGSYLVAQTPLDHLPIYVAGGSIIPFGPVMQYTDQHPLDHLVLEVYLDSQGKASGQLYEDAGNGYEYEKGQYCRTTYEAALDPTGKIRLTAQREGDYKPAERLTEIRIHHANLPVRTARFFPDNGQWDTLL